MILVNSGICIKDNRFGDSCVNDEMMCVDYYEDMHNVLGVFATVVEEDEPNLAIINQKHINLKVGKKFIKSLNPQMLISTKKYFKTGEFKFSANCVATTFIPDFLIEKCAKNKMITYAKNMCRNRSRGKKLAKILDETHISECKLEVGITDETRCLSKAKFVCK